MGVDDEILLRSEASISLTFTRPGNDEKLEQQVSLVRDFYEAELEEKRENLKCQFRKEACVKNL